MLSAHIQQGMLSVELEKTKKVKTFKSVTVYEKLFEKIVIAEVLAKTKIKNRGN